MRSLLFLAALALVPSSAHAQDTTAAPAPQTTTKPAEPVKGSTRETAYKVKSIGEEYAIMRKLGITVEVQSLVTSDDGHPYDVLRGTDANGEKREVWFDIKSFFGKEGF